MSIFGRREAVTVVVKGKERLHGIPLDFSRTDGALNALAGWVEALVLRLADRCGVEVVFVERSQPGAFPEWTGSAMLLVDLDAFFASVEQLDHPEWRGKPVIVGGDPAKRGVVSTCSYEARAFGVHSAMPSSQAARLCPDAIWCQGRFDRYRELSDATMSVIYDETPLVQQVSIDEAFADITPTRTNREHPLDVAMRIQQRVAELGITCSIGLSATKSVSKIASEMDKPNGLTVVYPGSEREFLAPLPTRALSGIGMAAADRLTALGIETLGDMARFSAAELRSVFGVRAEMMLARARGEEDSGIGVERDVKSVSHERSFAHDLTLREDVDIACVSLLSQVCRRLRLKGIQGTTLTLKMRFEDRTTHTTQVRLNHPTDDDIALRPVLIELIDRLWSPIRQVRLLGVAVSGFDDAPSAFQGSLFEDDGLEAKPAADDGILVEDDAARRRLIDAFDSLKERFGEDAVMYGGELREKGNSTGTASKNPADFR